jgi:hypothetical protein
MSRVMLWTLASIAHLAGIVQEDAQQQVAVRVRVERQHGFGGVEQGDDVLLKGAEVGVVVLDARQYGGKAGT